MVEPAADTQQPSTSENLMSSSLELNNGPFAINCVSYSARGDHFVLGTSNSFQIYQTEPFQLVNKTDIVGGVKTIQLLNQGQKLYVAMVGSGHYMSYPSNKIVFWEVGQPSGSSEINFVPEVLSIKSIAGVLVAGLASQIRGFMLRDLSKFFQIKTCENPGGTFAIASQDGILSVASPNIQAGTVHFIRFRDGKLIQNEAPLVISAHQGNIVCLSLNRDGSVLATASEQGTLIRLFNTKTGEKLSEVRRGSEAANIKHLSFEWDRGAFLACCSDKHTIHIFKTPAIAAVREEQKNQGTSSDVAMSGNTRSYFSALSGMVAIAGSEWSFAQLRLESNTSLFKPSAQIGQLNVNTYSICSQIDEYTSLAALVKEDKVYALTSKGWLIRAPLSEAGGSLAADAIHRLKEEI